VVPVEHSRQLAQIIGGALQIIAGAGHGYDGPGELAKFESLALSFFKTRLA
jgi:hypothetical protein